MLADKIEVIGRAPLAALDTLARAVWQDLAAGRLTEAEADAVVTAIEERRRALRKPAQGPAASRVVVVREGEGRASAGNVAPRPAARSGPRQLTLRIPRPARYDRRKSVERRRRLAYSGPMPAHLAQSFTPAEVAVLRIVADAQRDHGGCARSVGEIAARAGVCVRTAQSALRHAERLGLVTITERRRPGARSLTNIVRVVSREWLAWIEHHSKARDRAGIGCRTVQATENIGFQENWRGGRRGRAYAAQPAAGLQ